VGARVEELESDADATLRRTAALMAVTGDAEDGGTVAAVTPHPAGERASGPRHRRVARIAAGATSHLESGETVQELVEAQSGPSPDRDSASSGSSGNTEAKAAGRRDAPTADPQVLLATERHLYAIRLSGPALLEVGEVVLKLVLSDVTMSLEHDELRVDGHAFRVAWAFGADAERLVAHVNAAG